VRQLNRVKYLSTLDNDKESFSEKKVGINIAQVELTKAMRGIRSLLIDLEPDSPTYQALMAKGAELGIILQGTLSDEKILRAFDDQVDKALEDQGTPYVETKALKLIDEEIKKSFELADAQESSDSPTYKALIVKIKALAKQRNALAFEANPNGKQVFKEISDKNKAALENGTHEFSDIRERKILSELSKIYNLSAGYKNESATYKALMGKAGALEALKAGIGFEKTSPVVSQMYKDQADIFLKTSTLNWESDEYQALMNKLNTLQANTKTLEYAESNPALSAAWKKEADLFAILETVGTESSEGQKILVELEKLQIERTKIRTTSVTSANTETPTETSIDLPVMI
jgi:hypothetical protein